MPAEQALNALRQFDVEAATLSVWTLKKSQSRTGRFKAQSVVATPELVEEFKDIASARINRCAEVDDYNLITQIPGTKHCPIERSTE